MFLRQSERKNGLYLAHKPGIIHNKIYNFEYYFKILFGIVTYPGKMGFYVQVHLYLIYAARCK
jgi:hypothetical protein